MVLMWWSEYLSEEERRLLPGNGRAFFFLADGDGSSDEAGQRIRESPCLRCVSGYSKIIKYMKKACGN